MLISRVFKNIYQWLREFIFYNRMTANYFAFIAGTCAAGAGLFGKLSGFAYESIGIIGSGICIAVMIILNTVMWTNFSKALKMSSTTIGPTVTSSASNFLLSGMLGAIIFNEKNSIIWWSGIGLVLIGLLFITQGSNKDHDS